jgi:hypothetical protein
MNHTITFIESRYYCDEIALTLNWSKALCASANVAGSMIGYEKIGRRNGDSNPYTEMGVWTPGSV